MKRQQSLVHDPARVVLHPAELRENLLEFALRTPAIWLLRSKSIDRELVVP